MNNSRKERKQKEKRKTTTFDGPKKGAAVGVAALQTELRPREHRAVRVDVVDGELDGEPRRVANSGVVREEGAHGHLARPRPRRRHRPRGGGERQEPSHQLSRAHWPESKRH